MAKSITTLFFSSIIFFSFAHAEEEPKHSVLPAVLHFDGIGSVAALAVKSEYEGMETVAGVALGDVQGAAFSVSDVDMFQGKFSSTTLLITDMILDTQYNRGLKTSTEYQQSLSGLGQFLQLKTHFNQQQYWYANIGASLVSFDGYQTKSGETIQINMSGLHDVFSALGAVGVGIDETQSLGDHSGLKAKAELATQLFRPGQSDNGQINYGTSYTWALAGQTHLTTYAKGSHGFVIAKKAEYDEVSEVVAEIDGQCDTLTGTAQQNCESLQQDLASYIVAANNKGTAQALGGAYGLRSYSEQYIKAANAMLQGAEASLTLPYLSKKDQSLQLIVFVEGAQASDKLSTLLDDSLYSAGFGVRFNLKDLPIRLEAAYGSDDSQSWFLTAGKSW